MSVVQDKTHDESDAMLRDFEELGDLIGVSLRTRRDDLVRYFG